METFYCSLYSYYPCAINMIFLYTRENVGTTYLLFEFLILHKRIKVWSPQQNCLSNKKNSEEKLFS